MKKRNHRNHRNLNLIPGLKIVISGIIIGFALFFQNCGGGFKTKSYQQNNGSISIKNTDELNYSLFQECWLGENPEHLVSCFSKQGIHQEGFTQSLVDQCLTENNGQMWDVAHCLTTKGYPIHQYRQPKQLDLDNCLNSVGSSKILPCLTKKGIKPQTLTQEQVDNCLKTGTQNQLEKCLRQQGGIPNLIILSQQEFHICAKLNSVEQTASCLDNSGLLPANTTQTQINECVSSAGENAVVKCFRNKGIMSRVLMEAHVNRCVEETGEPNLLTCLNDNGLFLSGIDKSVANDCLLSGSAASLLKCLRTKTQLALVPTQEEIQLCNDTAGGENIANCLSSNGLLVVSMKNGITPCLDSVGPTSMAKCLRQKGYLSKALIQPDIKTCAMYYGNSKITDCLDKNGLKPTDLTQIQIDNCINGMGGLDGVANCLKTQRIIASVLNQEVINACLQHKGSNNLATCLTAHNYLPTGVTQNTLNSCMNNVGEPKIANCLTNNDYLPLIPTQDHFTSCYIQGGVDFISSCLSASGNLPYDVTQTQISNCVTNNGGVSNIANCLRNQKLLAIPLSKLQGTNGVFNQYCYSCHSGSNFKGNLNISNYTSLSAKVTPGNPAASLLYQKITAATNAMPPNSPLSSDSIKQVKIWILDGAQNN